MTAHKPPTNPLETKVREGLAKRRAILVTGRIDSRMIDQICSMMLILQIESNNPIILIIDSGGGSIFAALKLRDLIKHFITAPVYGVAIGRCDSAATFIMANCTKRMATPHTRFIIHSGTINFLSLTIKDEVTEEEMRQLLAETSEVKEIVISQYMDTLRLIGNNGKELAGAKRRARVVELINRGDQKFDKELSVSGAMEIDLIQEVVEGKLPIFEAKVAKPEPEETVK